MSSPGQLHELEYKWGTTQAWLGPPRWEGKDGQRCMDAFPPLSLEVLRSLDECLDVAPTPDFMFDVASIDGTLAITPREHCNAREQYLCDANSAYFVCAGKHGRIVTRAATPCWRPLNFATLQP